MDDLAVLLFLIDALDGVLKQGLGKRKFVLEQVPHELKVSAVEVVKDPCVEELQHLNLLYGALVSKFHSE